jgi:hypothetical protein
VSAILWHPKAHLVNVEAIQYSTSVNTVLMLNKPVPISDLIGHILIFNSFTRCTIGFRSDVYSIRNKNEGVGANIAFSSAPTNYMVHSFLFIGALGILQNVDCLF